MSWENYGKSGNEEYVWRFYSNSYDSYLGYGTGSNLEKTT